MSVKILLNLPEYLKKLQETADEVAINRGEKKIEVIHIFGEKFGCAREGEQLCLQILAEAQARVNAKYVLKTEG